ncbi:MAG TPA: deoxyribodipyrimidine photo-lyase [Pseudobdellovibrionaceae bacterium]
MTNVTVFWFRRDLRLDDNAGLFHALKEKEEKVLPFFIFDTDILAGLDKADARVTFIYQRVAELKERLQHLKSDLLIRSGRPLEVFKNLHKEKHISAIYLNHDYEPSAIKRDEEIRQWAQTQEIEFKSFKDQCLFEKDEIVTDTGKPYRVFTPYKNKVLSHLPKHVFQFYDNESVSSAYVKVQEVERVLTLKDLGFAMSSLHFPSKEIPLSVIKNYAKTRDFPANDNGTTHLGIHLRFGTISIRKLAFLARKESSVFLSELIWRDFFMQILWHYPQVEKRSYKSAYDKIAWRTSKKDFERWAHGMTGYPLVDAGMRELQETGHMHNRVRMVAASFLCKHLLIHWSEGEKYFAKKLLDFDLSANNGNWQWVAGSGCDAAPYFRIFNPDAQAKKFDPQKEYIKKWIPEFNTSRYPAPMIQHEEARGRCLQAYASVNSYKEFIP